MARTGAPDAGGETPAVEDEIDLGTEETELAVDENLEVDADGNPIEVDADADPETEPEIEDEDVVPPPRRGGGSETIRAQRRRAQEAEAKTAALEREIAELRGFQQGAAARQVDPQAAARAEQEFYASLEMMPPAQAYQALMQRGQGQVQVALQQIEFRSSDRADKQAYDIAARTSKVHQQYRTQVEQTLASERAAGRNPDREVILKYLVGNDVLERSSRAAPAQRNGAALRVASQRTQPTGARGDAARVPRRPQPGTIEHDEMVVADAIRRGDSVF